MVHPHTMPLDAWAVRLEREGQIQSIQLTRSAFAALPSPLPALSTHSAPQLLKPLENLLPFYQGNLDALVRDITLFQNFLATHPEEQSLTFTPEGVWVLPQHFHTECPEYFDYLNTPTTPHPHPSHAELHFGYQKECDNPSLPAERWFEGTHAWLRLGHAGKVRDLHFDYSTLEWDEAGKPNHAIYSIPANEPHLILRRQWLRAPGHSGPAELLCVTRIFDGHPEPSEYFTIPTQEGEPVTAIPAPATIASWECLEEQSHEHPVLLPTPPKYIPIPIQDINIEARIHDWTRDQRTGEKSFLGADNMWEREYSSPYTTLASTCYDHSPHMHNLTQDAILVPLTARQASVVAFRMQQAIDGINLPTYYRLGSGTGPKTFESGVTNCAQMSIDTLNSVFPPAQNFYTAMNHAPEEYKRVVKFQKKIATLVENATDPSPIPLESGNSLIPEQISSKATAFPLFGRQCLAFALPPYTLGSPDFERWKLQPSALQKASETLAPELLGNYFSLPQRTSVSQLHA